MSFIDSLGTSVFGMCVVFIVLIALSFVIMLQSKLVSTFKPKTGGPEQAEKEIDNAENTIAVAETEPAGTLKLVGVDDKTAATIMAIVSHESQTPLSELQFKSIKAVDSQKS